MLWKHVVEIGVSPRLTGVYHLIDPSEIANIHVPLMRHDGVRAVPDMNLLYSTRTIGTEPLNHCEERLKVSIKINGPQPQVATAYSAGFNASARWRQLRRRLDFATRGICDRHSIRPRD